MEAKVREEMGRKSGRAAAAALWSAPADSFPSVSLLALSTQSSLQQILFRLKLFSGGHSLSIHQRFTRQKNSNEEEEEEGRQKKNQGNNFQTSHDFSKKPNARKKYVKRVKKRPKSSTRKLHVISQQMMPSHYKYSNHNRNISAATMETLAMVYSVQTHSTFHTSFTCGLKHDSIFTSQRHLAPSGRASMTQWLWFNQLDPSSTASAALPHSNSGNWKMGIWADGVCYVELAVIGEWERVSVINQLRNVNPWTVIHSSRATKINQLQLHGLIEYGCADGWECHRQWWRHRWPDSGNRHSLLWSLICISLS